jgi:hypothetical protein
MYNINYIIATWSGENTKQFCHTNNPSPENTLKFHLEKLANLNHNLTQITIMMPKCSTKIQYQHFYDIPETTLNKLKCTVVFIECENFGYSNGQWLKCYEQYSDFDYFILIEDDYVPFQDNFDQLLISLYKQKFDNDIGKLCGYVQGYPLQKRHRLPLHYESAVMVSKTTMKKLYQSKKWKGDPRSFLDKTLVKNKRLDKAKKSLKSIGGFYQVNFSLLFTLIGIPLKDFSKEYIVPWYQKETNKLYHLKYHQTALKCFSDPQCLITKRLNKKKYLIVPLQMYFL